MAWITQRLKRCCATPCCVEAHEDYYQQREGLKNIPEDKSDNKIIKKEINTPTIWRTGSYNVIHNKGKIDITNMWKNIVLAGVTKGVSKLPKPTLTALSKTLGGSPKTLASYLQS